MKRLLSIMILLCGMGFSQTAFASIWSWVDSLTECTASGYTYCYDYTFTVADWDTEDNSANPCFGSSACTLFISHRHESGGTSGTGITRSWGSGSYPAILTAETMGELGAVIKSITSLPISGTTNHTGNSVATEECVGIFYATGTDLGTYTTSQTLTKFRGYPMMPNSICGSVPAPSGSCDFVQDSMTLDHGTLSKSELEGHQVSSTVNIACTSSKTLTLYIYAANDVQLRDDGSLYSELYMNDTILGTTGLTLDVDSDAVVDVKSVLRTNGTVAAGEFSGSTVMLITVE